MKKYFFIPLSVVLLILAGVYFYTTQNKSDRTQSSKDAQEVQKNFGPTGKPIPTRDPESSFLGAITEMTDDGFIVKNFNGSTATVVISSKTEYIGGKRAELVVEKKISGYGSKDSNGNIVAQKIQISPEPLTKPFMNKH